MSRIFKASHVTIDKDNVVNIEVMDPSRFAQAKPPEPVEQEIEAVRDEKSPEKIIENAKKEAQTILKKARSEAQALKNDMQASSEAEAKKLYEASKKNGYEEGYKAGVNETESLKRQAGQIYEDALAQREEMLNAVEGELVHLMVSILEKLLGNAVRMNPQIILHLVKQSFSSTTINGDIMLHTSGEDYAEVLQHKDELLPLVDGSVKLDILKDLSLHKGDCVIETPFGNIDCSLDRQFDSLKQDLYYILESADSAND